MLAIENYYKDIYSPSIHVSKYECLQVISPWVSPSMNDSPLPQF